MTVNPGSPLVFSTDGVPAGERWELFLSLMAGTQTPSDMSTPHADDFRAVIRHWDLGVAQVTDFRYRPVTAHRTPALIRASDPERIELALMRTRHHIAMHRASSLPGPGEFLLYDTSHPFFAHADDAVSGLVVVSVPRALVPLPSDRVRRLMADQRLDGASAVGAATAGFLNGLTAAVQPVPPADAPRLGAAALKLVTAFLGHHLDAEGLVPEESRRLALVLRIRAFIDDHLGDRELGPQTIAAAHHISARYLHVLFQPEGITVSALIKRRRLENCRRDLADPRLAGQRIGDICAHWGFEYPQEFSRAFRAVFGVSPRDYRHAALAAGGSLHVQ